MGIIEMTNEERKHHVKSIEKVLRNYMNYKLSITNIQKRLEFISSIQSTTNAEHSYKLRHDDSIRLLQNELSYLTMLTEAIDKSILELSYTEQQFIKFRYFKKWSIEKCAMEIGYSDKALFTIRNQIMDKLLISLKSFFL